MKNPFVKLLILMLIYTLTPTTTFAVGESSKADCVDTVQMTRNQESPESEERGEVASNASQNEGSREK